jgi:membrane protein
MIINPKKLIRLFYDAAYHTVYDDGIEHAGYLAFLGLLALFPAIIFLFSIASIIGHQEYGVDIINQLYDILPKNITTEIEPIVNQILSGPPQGLLTIALIGIIWTASGAVEGTRTILNKAYKVTTPPNYFFRRGLSILQFIIFIFVLVIAMFFLTIVPKIIGQLEQQIGFQTSPDVPAIRYLLSAFALFLVVSLSYYILPNIKQKFTRVLPGAKLCVVLWLLTIEVFTNVIAHYSRINAVYGSLAGVIITLVFFYIISLIYIYAAEFNYYLEIYLGHKIEEKEHLDW